ncbi:AAA family ATPase [Microbacterium laevaniformans]|uniref:AAA family ATPase n=1 Tax=Microbacterium laevaniformans TaxID=36807 RepID=UPI00363B013F
MVTTRITRLTRIASFRAFQNWSDDGLSDPFKRVNVIYGVNGSGKSTLAHLFRAAADGQLDDGIVLEFAGISGTRPLQIRADSTDFWQCVRVFNDKYIDENLRFDDVNGPSPDSLLTLGQVNVANEADLEAAKLRRETARADKQEADATLQAKTRQLDRRLSAVAADVVRDLSGSGVARFRATNVYNRTNVATTLSSVGMEEEGATTDGSDDLKLALAPRPERLDAPSLGTVAGASIVERTGALLNRDVTSVVLDELREPANSRWVQGGIHLHQDREQCLFCGGEITEDRRNALAAHFDDALTNLQREIADVTQDIERSINSIDSFERAASLLRSNYPELQDDLGAAIGTFETEAKVYRAIAGGLIDQLEAKRNNPFQGMLLAPTVELNPPNPSDVLEVIRNHNELTARHGELVEDAANRVELAKIRSFKPEHDELEQQVKDARQRASALEEEIRSLTSRIVGLENVETDPIPKAEELTKHVSRLLGRTDLEFEMDETTNRYVIKRNGEPATHLSEGERTAIALLHFLVGVREDSILGDPPVIVIDDPVSSLDDSILFGVSSYLWAELVTNSYASQVFLLTHKFELFRQWVIQIESAAGFIDGEATIQEIRMRYEVNREGTAARVPRLTPWTTDKQLSRRLRSLYHFLFARVATALLDSKHDLGLAERMELLSLVPNAARKMLEGFLSFRYPEHIGNFHGGMRAALASIEDAALRTRIERYLHAYSHNEEGDISASLDPSEVGPVIQSLFELMCAVDRPHFYAMCKALDIDANALMA